MEIESFDSIEDMFTEIRKWEDRANEQVTPEQTAIGEGDYWARPYEGFVIFGRVAVHSEVRAKEKELGADEEELEFEDQHWQDTWRRGYRFGMAYSVACPEGELGTTHISVMTPITEFMYNQAKERHWDFNLCLHDGLSWAWNLIRTEAPR